MVLEQDRSFYCLQKCFKSRNAIYTSQDSGISSPSTVPPARPSGPVPSGHATNLVLEFNLMGNQSLAESVQALQTAVDAMKADQDELRQMIRQLLARKERAEGSSSHEVPRPHPEAWPMPTATAAATTTTVPKFTRLEFPSYDGREDPTRWLHHCEQIFKAQNIPVGKHVSLAAFHLTGVAQMWHFCLEREEPELSWPQFKQRCYLRFGPSLPGNALGNLAKLNQGGRPVEDYNDEFQLMLLWATTVRHDQEVDLYTAGLDDWLRIDVENQNPSNLDVAMNLARSYARR